jgi:hypothetical protein
MRQHPSLVKSKGSFTLKVDHDGNSTLFGKAGNVRFSVKDNINSFSMDLKYASICSPAPNLEK